MKRWSRSAAAILGVFAFVLVLTPTQHSRPAEAADDPLVVVQNLIDAANQTFPNGDGAPFANMFTENGVFTNQEDAFAIVGRPALTALFSDPDPNFSATLIDSQADGNTVTGSASIVDQDTVDAGVPAHIELFTAVVEGKLVASFTLTYDHTDPDTQTYLDYLATLPDDEEEGPPPGAVTIPTAGTQPGEVTVAEVEGFAAVFVNVQPGAAGAVQPAHIHTGTCAEPGPIVYPLASVVDGGSFTFLSTTQQEVLNSNYIVNVHLSAAEPTTYVSCAVLAAPAAATPTPGTTLPNTGTGGSDSDASALLFLALAIAGATAIGGGAYVLRRR